MECIQRLQQNDGLRINLLSDLDLHFYMDYYDNHNNTIYYDYKGVRDLCRSLQKINNCAEKLSEKAFPNFEFNDYASNFLSKVYNNEFENDMEGSY